ncbi:MAG: 2-dehydropantoate 2-reductase [Aliishimia sp.]
MALDIAIAGAGAIGFYVGGRLAQAGHRVRCLARARLCDEVLTHGLTLSDFEGRNDLISDLEVTDDAAVLGTCDLILVTVKSAATAEMGALVAQNAKSDAQVISLQNGVTNMAILRDALPHHDVRAGMVPFNVTKTSPGTFHRGTSGEILIAQGSRPLPDLSAPGLTWQEADDFDAVQWGKLLVNLNNALNALSDLPLLTQLHDRAWRRLMADQMSEALRVFKAASITPARFTAAPPALVPVLLRLPTPIFRRIAAQMLTIDPKARSSMWDDLTLRRRTEIDALQGAVLELGERHGVPCPLMTRVVDAVRAAELQEKGPPRLLPTDLFSQA